MGFREWGSEDLLCFVKDHFTLKKIHISAGKKGGLQYHRLKNEAGLIIEGELKVIFQNTEGSLITKVLNPGDVFWFPPLCIHQEIAVTDVTIIEVSTPHFNDRVRVEKDFGMDDSSGLPTTNINDIRFTP